MARYDKQADIRDQQAADWMRKQKGFYSEHTEQHLRNALRFAKGCAGSEAKARAEMIEAELKRR